MSAPNRYVPPRVAPPSPSRDVADLLRRAAEARAAGYEDLAAVKLADDLEAISRTIAMLDAADVGAFDARDVAIASAELREQRDIVEGWARAFLDDVYRRCIVDRLDELERALRRHAMERLNVC